MIVKTVGQKEADLEGRREREREMLRLRCRDTRCACVSALFAAALDWQQGTARGDGESEREKVESS